MTGTIRRMGVTLLSIFLSVCAVAAASPSADKEIASRDALVDGVKIHYMTAGHGPTVILLHGYAETSRMWRPIIPLLAAKFTVIAPDLPGIGDSEIPKDGLNMKGAAVRIHALAKSLGITKARVVGHDIGLMVAYAYAAQYPEETEKLVVMDAFLPGVAGWEQVYNNPGIWHFRFNGPTPEALVKGASAPTSSTIGMTLPPTNRTLFLKPIEWHIRRCTLVPAACGQAGNILCPSFRLRMILKNSPKPN